MAGSGNTGLGYNLKIHSLNINGLKSKQIKTIDFINMHKIDILLIQETHSLDLREVTHFFYEKGFIIHANKVENQYNNYDGTAVVYSKRLQSTYKVENWILQENRLQKVTLVNISNNENLVLYNAYFKSGSGSYAKRLRCKTIDILEKDFSRNKYSKFFIL